MLFLSLYESDLGTYVNTMADSGDIGMLCALVFNLYRNNKMYKNKILNNLNFKCI